MKRILAFFLTVLVVISLFRGEVFAATCEYGSGGCGGKEPGASCTVAGGQGVCRLMSEERGECDCISGATISVLNRTIFDDPSVTKTKYGIFETPGGIITAAWPYLFAIAGLILFGMLMWGALEIQFGAADLKSAESGKKRITQAVIGFILLFSTFWMGQIIQQIFGLNFAVGQEVSVPAPGSGSQPLPEPPEPVEPLESFTLTGTLVGDQLRLCASSSQDLSLYPITGVARLFLRGEQVGERPVNFQSGSTTRCARLQSTSTAQQMLMRHLYEAQPQLEAEGFSWTTEVLIDSDNKDVYYTMVPRDELTLSPEVHQQLWNAVVTVNTSGWSEAVRVDIDEVAAIYSIRYRVDGVSNPNR